MNKSAEEKMTRNLGNPSAFIWVTHHNDFVVVVNITIKIFKLSFDTIIAIFMVQYTWK